MPDLRELAPSNCDGWGDVYAAVDAVDAGMVNVWDAAAGQLLGSMVFESGTTIATLEVVSNGISTESGGKVWRPTLPLVDITPLDNRGSL